MHMAQFWFTCSLTRRQSVFFADQYLIECFSSRIGERVKCSKWKRRRTALKSEHNGRKTDFSKGRAVLKGTAWWSKGLVFGPTIKGNKVIYKYRGY